MVSLRQHKKDAARGRILEAAGRLFGEHGVAAVTVERIAAEARVGKGSVYLHFAAKEDMVVALVAEIDQRAFEAVPAMADEGASAAEVMDRVGWSLLEAKAGHYAFMRAFLSRMFAPNPMTEHLQALQGYQVAALEALLRRLQARGLARQGLRFDELTLSFRTMHLGLLGLWVLEGPPFAETRRMTRLQMRMFAGELAP
jgi:AcrR family transcriptional regulator